MIVEIQQEEVRGKRPFKIWDSSRNVRKGLVVTSFEELIHRGKEKLSVAASEPVRLVLESDGTQVEDGEYWRTLPPNTVLLLLRSGERWYPTGVDVIKAAISAIPKIVCETIHALELHDETPSWKIMDNKGHRRPSLVIQTSLDRPAPPPPHITVVNHDEPGPAPRRLSRAGSHEHAHVHTAECRTHAPPIPHQHHTPPSRPPQDECDFHCCALHEEGRRIAVHKSVATSPIQDAQPRASPQGRPKGHVRFLDAESARRGDRDSSESETENTLVEDEAVTSEKFLLLIDQLSVDQKRHLTIKDIGIILERLSSKILDVERLDRESESDDCYNWTIKATIRGDALRELGARFEPANFAICTADASTNWATGAQSQPAKFRTAQMPRNQTLPVVKCEMKFNMFYKIQYKWVLGPDSRCGAVVSTTQKVPGSIPGGVN
ncbi:CIDE-N domain-containing protein [Phthorimaea operculella]|nr:CIDE-N domain-containing protein [Phthorimaea operculella]